MLKFRCTRCEETATAGEWDHATVEEYGYHTESITSEEKPYFWFICPNCLGINDGEFLEEVE